MDTKAVFEALPQVNTIWVVGECFHLHPNYGGQKVERNPQPQIEEKIEIEKPIKKHKK